MGFDLGDFQRTGIQLVKDFFEPEMGDRFAALGQRIAGDVRTGAIRRDRQFMAGLDVDAAAHISDSPALHAVAQQVLGPDVHWLVSRVLMKDKSFSTSIDAHQDWPYFGGDTRKLNVFVPLTRCWPDNGMLVFFEGSHTLGPVERGSIDVDRYPMFPPVCPDLAVGDVLFADFLSWHSSVPAVVDDDRILLQVVLQPASDRSSNNVFGKGWTDLGPVNPLRSTPMKSVMPSVGIRAARELLDLGAPDEAERMARGLADDSDGNVDALLLLHEIASGRGDAGYLAAAEAAVALLGEKVRVLRPPEPVQVEDDGRAVLQAHVAELTAELGELRRSTSWRLTAPLRWLRTRLGGPPK